MEFKLPKKYDDGFNKAGDDVIAEEDNNMSQVTTSSATQKSSPVKKFGKIHKKTLEPSPLTLSRVGNEIDNKTNSVKSRDFCFKIDILDFLGIENLQKKFPNV